MSAIKSGSYTTSMVFHFISVNEIGSSFLCIEMVHISEAGTDVLAGKFVNHIGEFILHNNFWHETVFNWKKWSHKYFLNNEKSLYALIMSHTRFRLNLYSVVAWISRSSLLETVMISEISSDCNGIRTYNHIVRKRTINHLTKQASLPNSLRTKWL